METVYVYVGWMDSFKGFNGISTYVDTEFIPPLRLGSRIAE